MDKTIYISKSKLKQGDLLESLRFLFYGDNERFQKQFEDIAKVENNDDLTTLYNIAVTNSDIDGKVKIDGQPYKFSVIERMNKVKVRHNVLNSSGIRLID